MRDLSHVEHGNNFAIAKASLRLRAPCGIFSRVLPAGGASLLTSGMEASQKRPGLPRPSGVKQRVMLGALLARQLGIAQFDRPLFDVEAKLRVMERQFLEAAEQPYESDPVKGRKIAPEHGVLVMIGERPQAIADGLAAHTLAVELRTYVLLHPWVRLRPVDVAALRVELATVFGDDADTDEINRVRFRDELSVDPIFHGRALGGKRRGRDV
jgi:hypothetical protein